MGTGIAGRYHTVSVGDLHNCGSNFDISVMEEEAVAAARDWRVFHAINANHGRVNDIRRYQVNQEAAHC